MRVVHAAEEAIIPAAAGAVYKVLTDYRDGHSHILPQPPFSRLDVEEGGIGAGTVIQFTMRVFGRERSFRARVDEPVPDRVLVEAESTGRNWAGWPPIWNRERGQPLRRRPWKMAEPSDQAWPALNRPPAGPQ